LYQTKFCGSKAFSRRPRDNGATASAAAPAYSRAMPSTRCPSANPGASSTARSAARIAWSNSEAITLMIASA
jgi:hypothetical protein